ncbi:hypothetical protein J3R30DRAFT_1457730 [Lentinula aciculospora]|uniref:Uncharacterized protein n=1 Tax=Lentinula aciculospora TaxID=153920 RepID=A0A9W9DU15_9AGAR|nr:hypothetical protein J3R30DRAFT_1457730 [Lentinula aciculospora]
MYRKRHQKLHSLSYAYGNCNTCDGLKYLDCTFGLKFESMKGLLNILLATIVRSYEPPSSLAGRRRYCFLSHPRTLLYLCDPKPTTDLASLPSWDLGNGLTLRCVRDAASSQSLQPRKTPLPPQLSDQQHPFQIILQPDHGEQVRYSKPVVEGLIISLVHTMHYRSLEAGAIQWENRQQLWLESSVEFRVADNHTEGHCHHFCDGMLNRTGSTLENPIGLIGTPNVARAT